MFSCYQILEAIPRTLLVGTRQGGLGGIVIPACFNKFIILWTQLYVEEMQSQKQNKRCPISVINWSIIFPDVLFLRPPV